MDTLALLNISDRARELLLTITASGPIAEERLTAACADAAPLVSVNVARLVRHRLVTRTSEGLAPTAQGREVVAGHLRSRFAVA